MDFVPTQSPTTARHNDDHLVDISSLKNITQSPVFERKIPFTFLFLQYVYQSLYFFFFF